MRAILFSILRYLFFIFYLAVLAGVLLLAREWDHFTAGWM